MGKRLTLGPRGPGDLVCVYLWSRIWSGNLARKKALLRPFPESCSLPADWKHGSLSGRVGGTPRGGELETVTSTNALVATACPASRGTCLPSPGVVSLPKFHKTNRSHCYSVKGKSIQTQRHPYIMANRKMVQSPMVWNRAGGLAEHSALETECVHWPPPEARVAPWEGDTGGSSPSRSWGGGFQASVSSCSTELGHNPKLVAPGSLCFVRDVFQVPVTAKMAQLRSRRGRHTAF